MKTISITTKTLNAAIERNITTTPEVVRETFKVGSLLRHVSSKGDNFSIPVETGGVFFPYGEDETTPDRANGTYTILTHVEKATWADSEAQVVSFIRKRIVWSWTKGLPVTQKVAPGRDEITRLRIEVSGRMSLTRNGKIMTNAAEISKSLGILSSYFHIEGGVSYQKYMLSRSPKLQAANFPEGLIQYYYGFPELGRKAYRYLAAGKTSQARSVLLTGRPDAPKGLLKALMEEDERSRTYNPHPGLRSETARRLLDDGVDIRLMASLVGTYKGTRAAREVQSALAINLKFPGTEKSVLAALKRAEGLQLLRDTFFLLHFAREGDAFTSVREAHDVLMMREIEASRPVVLPRLEAPFSFPVFEKDGLVVETANPHDLPELGRDLHICVGSYKENAWMGKLAISQVTREGKLVACLEWVPGVNGKKPVVVQAKLFANKRVATSQEVLDVVLAWAEANGMDISTSDLISGKSVEWSYAPDLLERVEAKAKAPKGEASSRFAIGNNFAPVPGNNFLAADDYDEDVPF